MDDTYIKSVSEFLAELPNENEFYDRLLDNLFLFRGQGNKEWNLMPSALRNREDILNEELYIKEFMRMYPEEFIGMEKIDILVKMQHYGIPTRLLDLTSNPLVALYFACVTENKQDGVVYFFKKPITKGNDLYVHIIMEYLFECKSHDCCWNDSMGEKLKNIIYNKLHIELERISSNGYKDIVSSNLPFIISVNYLNSRIKNQNGYFALYRGIETFKEIEYSKKIYIKAEDKKRIIAELERIGIHSGYIFIDLNHGAEYIVNSIRNKNLEFNKRFRTGLD